MGKIIEAEGLKKAYGPVQAVKGIDFYVDQGTLFSFLGPNGAGKSTTIDIISTLLKPDAGQVVIDGCRLGENDDAIRKSIGIVFQDSILDPLLTVRENLMVRGSFYELSGSELKKAAERAADTAAVNDFIDRPYGKLSGGQRRRADIARALVHTPKILFLDEPTTGLDPQTRKNVWQTIQGLQDNSGMTVFLTTHYMEEAANSDYVTVIGDGLILAKGTPLQLNRSIAQILLKIKPVDASQFDRWLMDKEVTFRVKNGIFEIKLTSTKDALPLLAQCREQIDNVEILNGTMDDVFIHITGGEVQD